MCHLTARFVRELQPTPESAGHARGLVHDALCPTHAARAEAAVMLLASELVSDAVLHGKAPVELSLECQGTEVRLAVRDGSPVGPLTDGSERELRWLLVDKVARRWGVEPVPGGREMWCTVPTGTVEYGGRAARRADPAEPDDPPGHRSRTASRPAVSPARSLR